MENVWLFPASFSEWQEKGSVEFNKWGDDGNSELESVLMSKGIITI